jgi:hypothetical protein
MNKTSHKILNTWANSTARLPAPDCRPHTPLGFNIQPAVPVLDGLQPADPHASSPRAASAARRIRKAGNAARARKKSPPAPSLGLAPLAATPPHDRRHDLRPTFAPRPAAPTARRDPRKAPGKICAATFGYAGWRGSGSMTTKRVASEEQAQHGNGRAE